MSINECDDIRYCTSVPFDNTNRLHHTFGKYLLFGREGCFEGRADEKHIKKIEEEKLFATEIESYDGGGEGAKKSLILEHGYRIRPFWKLHWW